MGEGEGKKDVTDQIEDENQLEGDRNEDHDQKEKGDQPPEPKEEDNALEMTNDFAGMWNTHAHTPLNYTRTLATIF